LRPAMLLSMTFMTTLLLASVAAVAGVAIVSQKGRAFSVSTLQVARGDVVRFANDDKFRHQIFVDATSFDYDSAEQDPGASVEIHFPTTGSFEIRCHIHPKMLLKVDVH